MTLYSTQALCITWIGSDQSNYILFVLHFYAALYFTKKDWKFVFHPVTSVVKTCSQKEITIYTFFITCLWDGLCSTHIDIICHIYVERHSNSESCDTINQWTFYVTSMVLRATSRQLVISDLETYFYLSGFKHNRSGMVAVLGPFEALPCYIHTSLWLCRLLLSWHDNAN
jgi:hypothetical protein